MHKILFGDIDYMMASAQQPKLEIKIPDYSNEIDLEVNVGMSEKWDAYEAGREVAKSSIEKLKTPPNFILLFSTIHYKEHGGFQEFLNGVWEVLPKGTPLIGGTIAGFINNRGCFAHGATSIAISYPNMDVSLGLGLHTKMFPKNAAKKCANMIKNCLKNSKYKNRVLFNLISAPTVPKIPFMGRGNFIESNFFGWLASTIGVRSFPLFGHGLGKEDDLVDELSKFLPNYYIIGGSSVDSGKYLNNYQFIDNQVHTNSIVALGCSIDLPITLKTVLGVNKTDKTFDITRTMYNNRIINKINNKPAKEQYLSFLGLSEEQFKDLDVFYSRTANYFPISFDEKKSYVTGTAGFLGNNIALGYKARGKKGRLLSISGREIVKAIDVIFNNTNNNKFVPFSFMSTSFIFLNTLGYHSYYIKEKLDEYLKDTPYLIMCPTAENAGTPNNPAVNTVYSFNSLSFDTKI